MTGRWCPRQQTARSHQLVSWKVPAVEHGTMNLDHGSVCCGYLGSVVTGHHGHRPESLQVGNTHDVSLTKDAQRPRINRNLVEKQEER